MYASAKDIKVNMMQKQQDNSCCLLLAGGAGGAAAQDTIHPAGELCGSAEGAAKPKTKLSAPEPPPVSGTNQKNKSRSCPA